MVSSEEEHESKPTDTLEWDADLEVQLFYAMADHKPVGINKHFQIICISEKLSNSVSKDITTRDIWKHLNSMYDLQMLDDTERIPFPNKEVPFSLPDTEYEELIKQKCKEIIMPDENEGGSSTPRSNSRGTTSKEITPKASRKDSVTANLATKTRKESASSHASTDTPSVKSEKEYDRRRDSRDSNTSGTRDSSSSRKSQKDKPSKTRVSAVAARDSPSVEEERNRRGRRRPNTSTPPLTTPAKRRRV